VGKKIMATTLTFTNEQIEIIGYALMCARRDQQGKLADVLITVSDKSTTKAAQVEGYRERIARLEEVAYLLPKED
jgi:hypothetical protein